MDVILKVSHHQCEAHTEDDHQVWILAEVVQEDIDHVIVRVNPQEVKIVP